MKTEAEIQELIEQRAEEFSTYRSDEPHEGLNIHAFDQYVGFKHGVTLGREIERGQVKGLVEAACAALDRPASMTFLVLLKEIKKYQAARGDDHE